MNLIPILKAILSIVVGLLAGNLVSEVLEQIFVKSNLKSSLKINKQILILFSAVAKYILLLVGFILAIAQFDVSESIFQIFSLVVVFVVVVVIIYSLKDIISNMLAARILFGDGLIEIGDVIEIDGFSGKIVRVTPLAIEIETDEGDKILLPNYSLVNRKIIKKRNTIGK
ncbi:hypothetical protein DRO91_09325 [Candidatus Heimdallarchaeota archaeon]|nr:MAG: hypothetical protein DRO91_09325 [Candidatus Heimdallarchaeota archaeon]